MRPTPLTDPMAYPGVLACIILFLTLFLPSIVALEFKSNNTKKKFYKSWKRRLVIGNFRRQNCSRKFSWKPLSLNRQASNYETLQWISSTLHMKTWRKHAGHHCHPPFFSTYKYGLYSLWKVPHHSSSQLQVLHLLSARWALPFTVALVVHAFFHGIFHIKINHPTLSSSPAGTVTFPESHHPQYSASKTAGKTREPENSLVKAE